MLYSCASGLVQYDERTSDTGEKSPTQERGIFITREDDNVIRGDSKGKNREFNAGSEKISKKEGDGL